MKLLKITAEEGEGLDRHFEQVETAAIETMAPEVIDGETDVKFNGSSVTEYDAAFAQIPKENAVFGRVLLEMLEEQGLALNYPSTGFFIMAKKNYLYHVLHQKDIPAPKTVVVAAEKAVRNVEKHLKGPLVARRFDELKETEKTKIDEVEQISEFAEGLDYAGSMLIFNEYSAGDKYRCLVAGDSVISLKDTSDSWKVGKDKLKYANPSKELKETVMETRRKIGTNVAEVVIRGEEVVDVEPNPDLEEYTEISGKDAYSLVADAIKGDSE
ncbi:MAG: RimK family alpha-L-glutamate ligase [Candidatus Nanohaloarchaea archaeon]